VTAGVSCAVGAIHLWKTLTHHPHPPKESHPPEAAGAGGHPPHQRAARGNAGEGGHPDHRHQGHNR
jgi:hypothetical protein